MKFNQSATHLGRFGASIWSASWITKRLWLAWCAEWWHMTKPAIKWNSERWSSDNSLALNLRLEMPTMKTQNAASWLHVTCTNRKAPLHMVWMWQTALQGRKSSCLQRWSFLGNDAKGPYAVKVSGWLCVLTRKFMTSSLINREPCVLSVSLTLRFMFL